jgi:hypothetical protein
VNQLLIIGMFFVLFLIKSYRSYDIKKMEVNGASETLINIKKAGNIKFSLILEFSQLLLKLYGALEFQEKKIIWILITI